MRVCGAKQERTHQTDQVCTRILLYISPQLPTRHPFRYKLEGLQVDTLERHDIGMAQVFPYNSLPAEHLRNLSGDSDFFMLKRYLCDVSRVAIAVYSERFDANIGFATGNERPLLCVTESSMDDRTAS